MFSFHLDSVEIHEFGTIKAIVEFLATVFQHRELITFIFLAFPKGSY